MNEVEMQSTSNEERKERIRKRYKGINSDELKVIPARPRENIFTTDSAKRVAVYARVSTDDPNQTSSYELQRNYYEDMVKKHENWTLVDIYADEGITGTSLNHREEFRRMIRDCDSEKIDLIITKNVARFARNIEDCIHFTRKLKNRKNPIGVLFENEGIYTLNPDSEMQLSFIATMAQEESHTKSVAMNGSYEMRFKRGIFLTPVLLGYDHDEEGNLVINPEEAKTVKLIFYLYLNGNNCAAIAETLNKLKRTTKKGNTTWSPTSIYGILKNERYSGDVLAHKTFTPDYLTHKAQKNRGDRPQYYQENHHEAIISRQDFFAVQKMMDANKYGLRRILPELKVIDNGVLKGFVEINPCWMGFSAADYMTACHSVLTDDDYLNPVIRITHQVGEFKFSGFEVARAQYSPERTRILATFSENKLKFSAKAIRALDCEKYVELLYHPIYKLLVVRKSEESNPHAIKWAECPRDKVMSQLINAKSFYDQIYQLCGWNKSFSHQLTGYVKEKNDEKVLMFYADEPEIKILKSQLDYLQKNTDSSKKKYLKALPTKWTKAFGDEYEKSLAKTISVFPKEKEWDIGQKGIIADKVDFEARPENEITKDLMEVLKEIKDEC